MRLAGVRWVTAALAASALLLAGPAPSRAQGLVPGEIFVTNLNGGRLTRIPANGSSQTEVLPAGMIAVKVDGDDLIVMTKDEVIFRYVFGVGGTLITSGGFLSEGTDIAVEPSGMILANNEHGEIIRINPTTHAQTVLSSGGFLTEASFGIAVGLDGQIYATATETVEGEDAFSIGSVIRINPVTGAQSLVAQGDGLSFPTGIVVGSDGFLYVMDAALFGSEGDIPSVLLRINPVTGAQTVLAEGSLEFDSLVFPLGLSEAPDGTFVVADAFIGVDRIDPATGEVTLVSSGGLLSSPFGVAVVPDGGASTRNSAVQLSGQALNGRNRVTLSGSVRVDNQGFPSGQITFSQGGLRLISRRIQQVVVMGNTARISGIATASGAQAVPFVITVVDGGKPGSRLDRFSAGVNGEPVLDAAVLIAGDIRVSHTTIRGRRGR